LSADRGDQEVEFNNVVIYDFSETSELTSITRAKSARHDGTAWHLERVSTVSFEGQSAVKAWKRSKTWPTQVRPELLDSAVTRPQRLSMRSLWDFLGYLGENGLDDRVYQAAFWQKVFYPLTIVALVLAGIPFVFASSRTQNVGVRMFIGMMLGGLYMIVSRSILNFGEAYGVPALLSNMLPALLLGAGGIIVLRRTV
jgi:lipopolysaccharide export system permease protein